MEERYLGDGVYASFDGYHIWLDLRGQNNTARIALDPDVFTGLIGYAADIAKHAKETLDGQEKPDPEAA